MAIMQELVDLYQKLNNQWKLASFAMGVLFCFWIIPFCLFKPEVFQFPFYAQITLIFALSITWLFSSLIFSLILLMLFDEDNKYSLAISSLVGTIVLIASILISYYYSNSFTFFLQVAYSSLGIGFVLQILIVLILKLIIKLFG
jgi:hypothetical protein